MSTEPHGVDAARRPVIPPHRPDLEAAPQPARPSARFTWGWRAATALCATTFVVLTVVQGMPVDDRWRWRVAALTVSAVLLGGLSVTVWQWAAAPRLTREQQARVGIVLGADHYREVKRALRRGAPLAPEWGPWARAHAASLSNLVLAFVPMALVGAGNAMASVSDQKFPSWFAVGFLAYTLLVAAIVLFDVGRQQRHADRLRPREPARVGESHPSGSDRDERPAGPGAR